MLNEQELLMFVSQNKENVDLQMVGLKLNNMSIFDPLEVVDRCIGWKLK